VPAVCEELLFRGFLLSGLRTAGHRWVAIITCGVIFGVYHFFLFKLPVTAMLGMVLAFLCWQSRSILPSMIAHLIHNTIGVLSARYPEFFTDLLGGEGCGGGPSSRVGACCRSGALRRGSMARLWEHVLAR